MDHFSTDRLTPERLREDQLADLVALHLDAEVSRYLGGVRSAEVTAKYLAVNMAHRDQHGFGLWALRTKDGAFAGRAGIRHILVDGVDEIEIAYTFKREFWGQGLASEVATALTDIGLSRLKRRLSLATSSSNMAHRAAYSRNRTMCLRKTRRTTGKMS